MASSGLQTSLKKLQRRLWMRYAMRTGGVEDSSDFDLAYRIEDPWGMDSQAEQARFDATNGIIERCFGRIGSLLELGCGEGHQTGHFARVSERQFGIDISPRAIERARLRLPAAQFANTDIFNLPWASGRGQFDLVTACEMLYCLPDPRPTLERMCHLGRNGLVTVFAPAGGRIRACLDDIPGMQRDWFSFGNKTWIVGWWRND